MAHGDDGFDLTVRYEGSRAIAKRSNGGLPGDDVYAVHGRSLVQVSESAHKSSCTFSTPAVIFQVDDESWANDYTCDRGTGEDRERYRVAESVQKRGTEASGQPLGGDCALLHIDRVLTNVSDSGDDRYNVTIDLCFSLDYAMRVRATTRVSVERAGGGGHEIDDRLTFFEAPAVTS
jgi:hypothetical protein